MIRVTSISEPDIEGFIVDIEDHFFAISDIEANNSISNVVYSSSTLKKPSISNPSILKKPSILGVARFQMEKLEYPLGYPGPPTY
jgi:hypothetical protein